MTQLEFLGQDDGNEDDWGAAETEFQTGPQAIGTADDVVEQDVPLHLFVPPEELYAPTGWGDLLRLLNFGFDDVRLVLGADRTWRLLVRNEATGMWRMQGRPDFPPLADAMLADANLEALRVAEAEPIITEKVRRKFQRHIETTAGGADPRALRRAPRLAEDRTLPIPRVDGSSLNPVGRLPLWLAGDEIISLTDGAVVSPRDLRTHYLLDMMPGPTAYVPDAAHQETPGAVMMRRFVHFLGNGDEEIITRRLGWQLSGRHATLDVVAGDHAALRLLARALMETLGPSGVHILSMAKGPIRARDIAHGLAEARLCVWPGADARTKFPVWEVNDLINEVDPLRQGNLLALVADWPDDWDTLDHRIADTCGWAWRVQGALSDHDIDVDTMLGQDGRECLLSLLVSGAVRSRAELQDSGASPETGNPGRVAATEYSLACAEEMRLTGSSPVHRALYRALQFTGDPSDVMTFADVEEAIAAVGEDPVGHHVIGKAIRQLWPAAEAGRPRIGGVQARVIRRVAARSAGSSSQPTDTSHCQNPGTVLGVTSMTPAEG